MGFVICNLSLYEITAWEPCILFYTDILTDNAARQLHCW